MTPLTSDSEVVVVRFSPVKKGQSLRLGIEETYTDPNRYGLAGDELLWQRSFGRSRGAGSRGPVPLAVRGQW